MLSRTQLRTLRRSKQTGPNRLRLAMKLAGVTQVQMGAKIDLAQSQISEDVNGKFSEISLAKARTYAEFFGCTVEDLFPAEQAVAS